MRMRPARPEAYALRDRVVLITGAARGIGAETARQVAARGAHVALVGLEPDRLADLAASLGDRAAWFAADVADLAAVETAVAGTIRRFGGIDVVVANAGVVANGTVLGHDPAAFRRTVDVNLVGVWHTLRAAGPHVVARRGYLLPVASLAAALHGPLIGPYAATKAGVEALANSLRSELAHTGTRVGVAYFGFIATDMVDRALAHRSTQRLRDLTEGPLTVAPVPVARAGEAIVRAVERRARIAYAPGFVGPLLWLRTLLQPLGDARIARQAGMAEAMALADAEPAALSTPAPQPGR